MCGKDTTLFILIDTDNFYHCLDSSRLALDLLHDVRSIVLQQRTTGLAESVNVRLYGGWMMGGMLSQAASRTLEAVALSKIFPFFCTDNMRSVVRGSVALATELLALPNVVWNHTCCTISGAGRLRLRNGRRPRHCGSREEDCLAEQIVRFTRSKSSVCPTDGCVVTNGEAFETVGQKMVDTFLVCDLLCLSQGSPEVVGAVVASDDWDLLPGVAAAASAGLNVTWVRKNRQRLQPHDRLLEKLGVGIREWR